MHCFAEPGKLPKSYVMCTQGQKQIGQAGPVYTVYKVCLELTRSVCPTVCPDGRLAWVTPQYGCETDSQIAAPTRADSIQAESRLTAA